MTLTFTAVDWVGRVVQGKTLRQSSLPTLPVFHGKQVSSGFSVRRLMFVDIRPIEAL